MNQKNPIRRINIMIGEQQYDRMTKAGINVSALIRDLVEDHFSEHVISLSVSKETHDLYHKVLASTGASDADFEPLLVEMLKKLIRERIKKIEALETELG